MTIWVFSEIFSPLGTLSPVSFFVSQCVYVCLGSICVCVCVLGRSCVRGRSCCALKLLCLFLTAASNSSHVYVRACIDVCVSTWSLVLTYTLYVWIVVWLRRGFNIGSQIENLFFFWLAAQCGRFQLRSNYLSRFFFKINFIAREIFFYSKLSLCSL